MTAAAKLLRQADLTADSLKARRLRGVAAVLGGSSISAAARQVGMDRPRLSHWCAMYREHGVAGLEDRRTAVLVLTDRQVARLRAAARGKRPDQLAAWAEREFNADYVSMQAVRAILLERAGLEWRRGGWRVPGR
jgi:transposase